MSDLRAGFRLLEPKNKNENDTAIKTAKAVKVWQFFKHRTGEKTSIFNPPGQNDNARHTSEKIHCLIERKNIAALLHLLNIKLSELILDNLFQLFF